MNVPSFVGGELLEPRCLLSADSLLDDWSTELVAQPFVETSGVIDATPANDLTAEPLVGSASPVGNTPAQIRHAYGFDQINFVDAQGNTIIGDGAGQTIAIVNAYHTPNAAADLAAFSTYFGLQQVPTFTQVNQTGGAAGGASNSGWALETALDVQWAHALAPAANILLVEATSAGLNDLVAAVDYARNAAGVSVVSMSWGVAEFLGENGYDFHFTTPTNHQGVTFFASAGNSGGPGFYPAYSPNVVATGGTRLTLNGSNNITSETAWGSVGGSSGSGGGISQYESQPSWQNGVVTQTATQRAMPDVSFLADPSTGVAVYDTFNNDPGTPWRSVTVGGTSLAAPSWAALVAVANQGRNVVGLPTLDTTELMTALYTMPSSNFRDIVSGTGGGTIPQTAGVGFDLVTGLGSPRAQLITAALVSTGTITGTVFNDVNGNGTQDGESGLSNWRVYADLNNNAAFDPVVSNNFNSSDAPKSIPASGSVTSNNVVAGLAGDLIDINVTVNISHTRTGDLVLTLIAPDLTEYTLSSQVGGTGDHYSNTVFDDSAGVSIERGTAPFSGSFHPTESLASLFGSNPNGTWKLRINDVVAGTSGTLNSWSLQIKSGDPNTLTAANGTYKLGALPSDNYALRQVPAGGSTLSTPVGGVFNLNLNAAETQSNKNFGVQLGPSAAPTGVTLNAASDTGILNSDGITRRNNASPGSTLQFEVSGTIAGATVNVYADGVLIGSAVASGPSTTVITNGSSTLAEGANSITARQTEVGKPISVDSPTLVIQIDTVAPVATIVPVSPNPRTTPVSQFGVNFSEPVPGLVTAGFDLTRNNGPDLLTGAQSVNTADNLNWTLSGTSVLTTEPGSYELLLKSSFLQLTDVAGNVANDTSATFVVAPTIVGRRLFYNQSIWDGQTPGVSTSDDAAIAVDKTPFLANSGTATFDNISSFTRGLNGIMIDLSGSHPSLTLADFAFKMGDNNSPETWIDAPAPAALVVRAGAGQNGSDRVELIWGANAVKNQWLQVTVKGNDAAGGFNTNTGLLASDVFYFGSRVGDTGSGTPIAAVTSSTDEVAARNNLGAGATISNIYDFDRNGIVQSADANSSRNNTGTTPKLNLGNSPAAPEVLPVVAGFTAMPMNNSSAPLFAPAHRHADTLMAEHGLAFALAVDAWRSTGQSDFDFDWNSLDDDILDVLAARGQRIRGA